MSSAYDWMDYSEKRLRAEITKLPDGEYVAPTAWLDDDGRNRDVRLRVETKIIVQGDHITIDLTGSNAEVPTGYNVPFEGSLLVGAYFAIRTLLLDQDRLDEPVPQNDGIFRCVTVVAPKGTIFNPNFPRACFSRFCQVQRVVDNTIVALSAVVPDLVTAGNSAALHFCSYAGFIPEKGEYWLYLEVDEGSYGGRKGRDGMDSVDCLMANTRNNPIEELDMRFPMRCDRYELRDDPAAPGQWRGGIGIVRKNRFLEPGVYSCEGDRHTDPPRGIFGGYDGLPGKSTFIDKDGNERDIPAKVTGFLCGAGEIIQLTEPNSGGYGNPLDREPQMVLEDVLDDFTTIELAREAYGVVISEGLEIDEAATEAAARQAAQRARGGLPGRAADARLDAAPAGDLALREGDVTDGGGYGDYGRGTVEPGDRPAILVVDYQKAFTTDGLGMGGTPLIERGVVNTARLLPVARETGVPVFQFHVSFGEAEGGLGLWSRKVPKLARDHGSARRGSRSTSACRIRPTR